MADEPDPDDPPLFAGKILGVREWTTNRHCERLGPLVYYEPWRIETVTEARCGMVPSAGHSAPEATCECGLYAYHPWSAEGGSVATTAECDEYRVAGVVEAWGKVELHGEGFRAQFARPVAFLKPANGWPGSQRALERLSRKSGAELIDPAQGGSIAGWVTGRNAAFDRHLVTQLLPERKSAASAGAPTGAIPRADPEVGWGEALKILGLAALEGLGSLIAGLICWAVVLVVIVAILGFLSSLFHLSPGSTDPSTRFDDYSYSAIDSMPPEKLNRILERGMRRLGHKNYELP